MCECASICACTRAQVHVHVCKHFCSCSCVFVCLCVRVYVCACACACMSACTSFLVYACPNVVLACRTCTRGTYRNHERANVGTHSSVASLKQHSAGGQSFETGILHIQTLPHREAGSAQVWLCPETHPLLHQSTAYRCTAVWPEEVKRVPTPFNWYNSSQRQD